MATAAIITKAPRDDKCLSHVSSKLNLSDGTYSCVKSNLMLPHMPLLASSRFWNSRRLFWFRPTNHAHLNWLRQVATVINKVPFPRLANADIIVFNVIPNQNSGIGCPSCNLKITAIEMKEPKLIVMSKISMSQVSLKWRGGSG